MDKGYRRLTKDQPVGLRHAGFILQFKGLEKDASGNVKGLICSCVEVEKTTVKPKAFIHWVSNPVGIEIRLYKSL